MDGVRFFTTPRGEPSAQAGAIADPLIGAPPGVISADMFDVASAFALNEVALGRLARFAQRHSEAPEALSEAMVAHIRSLPSDHPARRALATTPADFYQRTAVRLLSGRLDGEVRERLRARALQLVADNTPPPLMFTYVAVVGPAMNQLASGLGYPPEVATELATTLTRVATVYGMESSNNFTELAVERAQGMEQLQEVSGELAGLSRRLESIAYSEGPSALSGRVESALSALGEVAANAADIGGIVELIRSIASQTNLLALNATIEAARAGQEGKGFAVVASEVKNLAHSTHQSLGRIEELVSVMQTSVDRASASVSGVEASTEELRATAESMAQISHVLQV